MVSSHDVRQLEIGLDDACVVGLRRVCNRLCNERVDTGQTFSASAAIRHQVGLRKSGAGVPNKTRETQNSRRLGLAIHEREAIDQRLGDSRRLGAQRFCRRVPDGDCRDHAEEIAQIHCLATLVL